MILIAIIFVLSIIILWYILPSGMPWEALGSDALVLQSSSSNFFFLIPGTSTSTWIIFFSSFVAKPASPPKCPSSVSGTSSPDMWSHPHILSFPLPNVQPPPSPASPLPEGSVSGLPAPGVFLRESWTSKHLAQHLFISLSLLY